MLSSYFLLICGYSDAYIAGTIKGTINRRTGAINHIVQKNVPKNNAWYRSWIRKINNIFTDHAEDLDLVMPMYNLLKYGDNYSMESRNL